MKLAVVGAGYVGLVTGVCLAETAGSRPLNAVVELIDGHPALANW